MAAHRYWRIKSLTGVSGQYFEVERLNFYTGYDNAAVLVAGDGTGTGTAIAGSAFSGYAASRAFDNNPTTGWSTANTNEWGTTGWIGYDFGAGNDKAIESFAIKTVNGNKGPNSFALEYSDNGTTWTAQETFTPGIKWMGEYMQGFTSPQALTGTGAQYWRMRGVTGSPSSGSNLINELKIANLSDVRLHKFPMSQPIASSIFSSTYNPAYAFDELENANYYAGLNSYPSWIGMRFGSKVQPAKFIVKSQATYQSSMPTSVAIEYSDDGISWTQSDLYSGLTWTSGETKTFNVSDISGGAGVVAARRRLVLT